MTISNCLAFICKIRRKSLVNHNQKSFHTRPDDFEHFDKFFCVCCGKAVGVVICQHLYLRIHNK